MRRFIWFLNFQNEIVQLEWDKDMPGFGRIFGTWELGGCLNAIQSQQYSRKICIDENFNFKSDLSLQVQLQVLQNNNLNKNYQALISQITIEIYLLFNTASRNDT
ncbi:Hypothetical_protein [Hexamita inflata]|uniref:Hypothetical_protein n=1 Tax=Hexamita inflata TaxID=28002 RepID=A0AA86PME6_9EUKA|nr:Hypothetical protein HINF_LOCUS28946 [Hexamita inflata]